MRIGHVFTIDACQYVLETLLEKAPKLPDGKPDVSWINQQRIESTMREHIASNRNILNAIAEHPHLEKSILDETSAIVPQTWKKTVVRARAMASACLLSKVKMIPEFRVKRTDGTIEFPESELESLWTDCNPDGEYAGDQYTSGENLIAALFGDAAYPKLFNTAAGDPRKADDLYLALINCAPPHARYAHLMPLEDIGKGVRGRKNKAVRVNLQTIEL